jgi:iron(III) transport system substrate-binding protein
MRLEGFGWFAAAAWCLIAVCCGCSGDQGAGRKEVVVYTSVDQVFAEPILKKFEEQSGIRVLAVYDVEANKTTGLANRLLAEAPRPKADVFWNGEFVQTLRLKEKDVLTPYRSPVSEGFPAQLVDPEGYWTGLTPRIRVFISSSDFKETEIPLDGLIEVDLPKDQMAISSPLFGTGSFQAAAMYSILGTADAGRHYQEIIDSGIRIEAGNSVVRDLVVAGTITLGLVDNDDACGAVRRGEDVRVFLPRETMLIPSTVAKVKGGPNPDSGDTLIDYLLGPQAETDLLNAGWSQVALHPGSPKPFLDLPEPSLIDIKIEDIAENLEAAHNDLRPRLTK